ncbi:response regulator transcription factor [Brevundimonas sp. R86498]|uniref:response regulator transcription factor n=1 Tax=Brevundimonas sp. R86498 TaxID=3093845 RepID=UPI0037C969B1
MNASVVLVDDDPAVLASLEALFEASGYVVHGFSSAAAFLARMSDLPVSCVVTDLRMPMMDGLGLLATLNARAPAAWPVVVISGYAGVADAVRVMQAGAHDLLLKPFSPGQLLAAVQGAWARRTVNSPEAVDGVPALYAALTAREKQVAEHLVAGANSRACAEALGISPRTVDVFRGRILRKMGCATTTALSGALAGLQPRTRAAACS